MSVAAQPRKRFFDAEENEDRLQRLGEGSGFKRVKQAASPSGRCAPDFLHQSGAYVVGQSTVAALRALFPEMNDKVIADVLAEYGDNIDAAIKHLTDLRLSQAQAPADAQAQQQQHQQQPDLGSSATNEAGQANGMHPSGTGASSQRQQQQHEHEQQQQQQQQPAAPRWSAQEWVDMVVAEMSQASSMEDARRRASSVLQSFEQAVLQHAKEAGGPGGGKLRGQMQEVMRENAILKRAVAIQNARMQEQAGREAELVQLRSAVQQYQQRCHALEVQNYSLAMHLKQATDSSDPLGKGPSFNPDVF